MRVHRADVREQQRNDRPIAPGAAQDLLRDRKDDVGVKAVDLVIRQALQRDRDETRGRTP